MDLFTAMHAHPQAAYSILMYVVLWLNVMICLPFVTIFTILNFNLTGLLSAPGFFTHTDTVPELYWGSSLMGTEVMGCLTKVEFI